MNKISLSLEIITEEQGIINLEEEYITLIATHGIYLLELPNKEIKTIDHNLLLMKNGKQIRYRKMNEQSNLYVLHMRANFFDTYLVSQMSDCPIIYDFLRLSTTVMEYLLFDISSSSVCKTYLKLLIYEASNKNLQDEKTVKCALILFLTNLHHIHQECLIISESSMMEDYEIGKYLKYMAENYATVTLSSMAEHFNFHPAYFSALFKRMAYCSFSQKLLMIKLEQAKRLLVTTDLSITHIIELIGFKEKSYFYKVFKNQNQITPLEYRERYRK